MKTILDLLKDGPMSAGEVCNELRELDVPRTIRRGV